MTIGTPVAGAAGNGAAATTSAVAYPASVAADDELIIVIGVNSATATSTPAGWTLLKTQAAASGPTVSVFRKKAAGGESGTVTVTHANATSQWQMYKVSGVDPTTPDDVAATSVAGTATGTYTIPGLTSTVAGVMLMTVGITNNATATWAPPTCSAGTFTELLDQLTRVPAIQTAYLLMGAAGATGNVTLDASTTVKGAGIMIALRPATANDQTITLGIASETDTALAATVIMPITEIEDFESGSDGASYTVSSGLADGGGGTGTAVYSAAAAINGALGLRITSTAGGNLLYRDYDFVAPSATLMWGRIVGIIPVPSNAIPMTIVQMRDASNNGLVVVRVDNTGHIIIRDGATNRGTSTYSTDGVTPVQIAYGVEGGDVHLKLYDIYGNLLEAEMTGAYSGAVPLTYQRVGIISDPTVDPFVMDWDEVGYRTDAELTPLALAPASIGNFGIPMN